jgi:hypothetical protein
MTTVVVRTDHSPACVTWKRAGVAGAVDGKPVDTKIRASAKDDDARATWAENVQVLPSVATVGLSFWKNEVDRPPLRKEEPDCGARKLVAADTPTWRLSPSSLVSRRPQPLGSASACSKSPLTRGRATKLMQPL